MAAILQVMEEDSQQEEEEEQERKEKEAKEMADEEASVRKEQEKVGHKGKVKEAAMAMENISRIASPAAARKSRYRRVMFNRQHLFQNHFSSSS